MGLQEKLFLSYNRCVSCVCVCVYVCRGRELIIPSLGVHYSNLWDALARSG